MFITAKKSQELVGKITQLSSRNKADELKRTLYAEGRIKPENEKIYYGAGKRIKEKPSEKGSFLLHVKL